jgi:hypothetical protein
MQRHDPAFSVAEFVSEAGNASRASGDRMQRTEPHFQSDSRSNGIARPTTDPSPEAATRPPAGVRAQAASSSSLRAGNASNLPVRPASPIAWVAALAAAPLAFVAALWLMSPRAPAVGIAALTKATVSDATTLMAAVQDAGLRGTSDIRGAIDEIKRLDGAHVTVRGWASDVRPSGSPLTVIAFAEQAYVLTATSDASTYLSHLVGLSDAAQSSTSFQGTLACSHDKTVVVVAVTSDGRYSQFRSLRCP